MNATKCSLNIAYSKEAKIEGKAYLNSKEAYINSVGGIKYGANNSILELMLFSLSRGLLNENEIIFVKATKDDKRIVKIAADIMLENPDFAELSESAALAKQQETLIRCTSGNNLYIYAMVNDNIVGFIRFDSAKSSFGIGILNKYRGNQYAEKLIDHLIETIKTLGYTRLNLIVKNENISARRLYDRVGFVIASVNTKYTNMYIDI